MKKMQLNYKYLPLTITILLFVVLFMAGSLKYTGFFSLQVIMNLFIDNAFLIIAAIGMTFVLLTGGIDISVGSVIALSCMIAADLLENKHMNPYLVMLIVLLVGTTIGFIMGYLIHYFKLQPFIVTLAGLFFARGLCYIISIGSISINDPIFKNISQFRIPLPGNAFVSISVIITIAMIILAVYLAHYTKFGRTVYAIGGNEQSALLMGLPVAKVKVLVYTLNGFCAALSGLVFSFYMLSGYGLTGVGMEMDVIASAVIGGTLLTGGVGFVIGSVFGALIQGIIQTIITFQGTLSPWWTRIIVALLICVFLLLQRMLQSFKVKKA